MTCTLYLHLEGTTRTYHLNVHVHGKLEILNGESNCAFLFEKIQNIWAEI